ncbi:MAG: PD-(D/E)XK nuclease family protein [Acidobacteriaceae bacterium]|nr:PD-(D/E)XK nuclease family protein [Acidobacteriaceae bacterium]
MPPRPVTLDEALALLAQKAVVLLPTARSAAALRQAFQEAQAAAGKTLWEPPAIYDWRSWLSSLFAELLVEGYEDRLLLNAAQEHSLWRDIVLADPDHSALAPEDALANLASSAFALASAWTFETRLKATAGTHDAKVFAAWAELFAKQAQRDRFLSASQLERALTEHLAQHHVPLLKRLYLLGFGEHPPAAQELLAAFEAAGTRLVDLEWKASTGPQHATTELPDERMEARVALRWLRQQMMEQPLARAALLIPELATERVNLEPLLREVLTPELQDIRQDLAAAPWEFSSGTPLASQALASDALLLLQWLRGALSLDRLSVLLLSPYTALAKNPDAAARFDNYAVKARPLLRPEMDLAAVLDLARKRVPDSDLVEWVAALAEVSIQLRALAPRRTYADWVETIHLALRTAGWPGPRPLSASETELHATFGSVLDLLVTLDVHGSRVTFSECLSELGRLCSQTSAPENTRGRLKVLSPEAAAGMAFDFAVFLRATDNNLPHMPRANPLLDRAAQRSLRMPGTNPEADAERAQRQFSSLCLSVSKMLFTHAAESGEGKLRASGWIADLPTLAASNLLQPEAAVEPLRLEDVPEDTALPPLPSREISGGARVLRLQAACGFQAFAEIRLGGREARVQDAGFDAIESGNTLHNALDFFWKQMKSQQALRDATDLQRKELLEAAVDHALARILSTNNSWDAAYLSVQREQMLTLLWVWLGRELERGPFEVVGSEHDQLATIGPLELKLRMDRIDRLPDGGLVYVDYKTGAAARPAAWQGDRPDDPQLPLYALQGEPTELRALTFAKLRLGEEMKWDGWQAEEGILPQKRPQQVDLEQAAEEWKRVLESLAEDFAAGLNTVSPKNYAINCQHCAQRLLCRVDANALLQSLEEEQEEGAGDV